MNWWRKISRAKNMDQICSSGFFFCRVRQLLFLSACMTIVDAFELWPLRILVSPGMRYLGGHHSEWFTRTIIFLTRFDKPRTCAMWKQKWTSSFYCPATLHLINLVFCRNKAAVVVLSRIVWLNDIATEIRSINGECSCRTEIFDNMFNCSSNCLNCSVNYLRCNSLKLFSFRATFNSSVNWRNLSSIQLIFSLVCLAKTHIELLLLFVELHNLPVPAIS